MFADEPTILSTATPDNGGAPDDNLSPVPTGRKKLLLTLALAAAIIIFLVVAALLVKKYWFTPHPATSTATSTAGLASTTPATLPNLGPIQTATTTTATSSLADIAVEYLSFANFYTAPDNTLTPKINDFSLPVNVKIDVMNYYDISRKLSLDAGLDDLNNQGFTAINNPWPQQAPDFYSLYGSLSSNQIPVLITSDFILYNYQNILKKSFKDIEANVFYDNLWDINQTLYSAAKNRYEGRLAQIGNVNDSVLEGERLETAFFAVALELLKPTTNQVAFTSGQDTVGMFSKTESNRFYFVVPPYLRDDVLAEEKLIREASQSSAKSPVLLYQRNYRDFTVPVDYASDAKLNNFYLTTKWLNSVFPLNYKSKDCSNCLLDQADWRVNLTAASLLAQDFSLSPDLKNKWARIYKVMSFFKGLRDDLNYVNYRDSLSAVFGADYQITDLFDDHNKQADANLEKLRAKLLTYNFPEISGGLVKTDTATKPQLGFKMLAESYWPNTYIFSRLTAPAVGAYQGTTTQANLNVTACVKTDRTINRCNGLALDAINLVYPIGANPYFQENTAYLNYGNAATNLRTQMAQSQISHLNNYWTTLSSLQAFLSMAKNNLPLVARSAAWQNKSLNTAAAAWVNLQLPLDNFVSTSLPGQSISNLVQLSQYSYVEPNLDLINELLANNNMLLGMFSALQLNTEVPVALQSIRNYSDNLTALRQIVQKELTGQALSADDNNLIADFTKQFTVAAADSNTKKLTITLPTQKTALTEDLSQLKLLVLIHQEGANKVFSVGPIWSYQESH
jgi:hypothetical protein